MGRRNSQRELWLGHHAIFATDASYQARGWNKPANWFRKGLERFVNADDSLQDYQALGKAFRSFWPLPLEDSEGNDLSWCPEAHRLFLSYRNLLRRFWARDPRALKSDFDAALLFGTMDYYEMEIILEGGADVQHLLLQMALAPLRKAYSGVRTTRPPLPLARFSIDWCAGAVDYVSRLDFQRAVWLLFSESWRAKICPRCSRYFLAQKPAQLYCSLSCSNAAHRASSLSWWKKKGSQRRAARTKAGRERKG